MNCCEKFFGIKSINCLKLAYSLAYIKLIVILVCLHLLNNLSTYTEQIDFSKIPVSVLRKIIDLRGLRSQSSQLESKGSLIDLVLSSGSVYEAELVNSDAINPNIQSKIFNSAGEFLESVEDSKDKVWLVHIVSSSFGNQHTGKRTFLDASTWSKLNDLSRFGILTGTFNCDKDPYFCYIKNWQRPQLVLGIVKYDKSRQPQEFVELFTYDKIKENGYEQIFGWLENTLTQSLVPEFLQKIYSQNNFDTEIVYIQNGSFGLPIYYAAMSVKYNNRAKFYRIKNENLNQKNNDENLKRLISQCNLDKDKVYLSKTPIYIIIDKSYCYNYGANLNELPNYVYLNQFLLFLHPDLNSIFLISFLLLNLVLGLAFFNYRKSFLKQLGYALVYLCAFNLILITLWLITTNSQIGKLIPNPGTWNYVIKILKWLRLLYISNKILQLFSSFIRFCFYYYFFLKSWQALVLYFSLASLFYAHTRWLKLKTDKYIRLKPSRSTAIEPSQYVSMNTNHVSPADMDIEISVSELINQINGLTTIWLQSSSYADRLISELPSVEYCKCFYANRVKLRAFDETDLEETTEDEEHLDRATNRCECGRNEELNKLEGQGERMVDFFAKFSHQCTICLQKYMLGNIIIILPCGHFFHKKCIYEWFMSSINYKCPMCRTSFYRLKKSI
ncbi:E3 ubiquitin-ligase RNF103-like [Brachionus plicatilis]|uniref:E3 ubiquitin-ligase RNF103-like n=1 Tax=Brachionus plicatilis TaxID=10195 RepID=A0A3M7QH47_BRAPC|nr:E3 ubiquitin-ligase RNF103-like [Brachionus plicatilis]